MGAGQPGRSGFQIGNKTLYGTLGLAKIIDMGLSVEGISGIGFPPLPGPTNTQTHPSFSSTVQFTLTRGFGAGPTWTFANFKGPSGTAGGGGSGSSAPAGLLSYGRTDTHNFIISFVPISAKGRFLTNESEASATANAASQALILDQRLQQLQPFR
jgi:hypothetical protein